MKIDKDFSPKTSTPLRLKAGFDYMTPQKSIPNYVYWNDVNELVERLKILEASKGAGNTMVRLGRSGWRLNFSPLT